MEEAAVHAGWVCVNTMTRWIRFPVCSAMKTERPPGTVLGVGLGFLLRAAGVLPWEAPGC